MKSAKEMFKKLGYSCKKINGNIEYCRSDLEDEIYILFVINSLTKQVNIEITIPCGYHSYTLSLEELKAINKQVEELGWNIE